MTLPYEKPTVTLLGRINSRADAPGDDRTVVSVDTPSGWSLVIVQRAPGFDITVTDPFGLVPYSSRWRETIEEAIEKSCDYVRDQLGQPHVATALRLMAQAEVRE